MQVPHGSIMPPYSLPVLFCKSLRPCLQIIVSVAEHHSNMVPWQLIAQQTGAVLKHVRLTADKTQIDLDHYRELLGPRTRLVSLVHVSNMLGFVLDTDYVVEAAHRVGAKVRCLADSCAHTAHLDKLGSPAGVGLAEPTYDGLHRIISCSGNACLAGSLF